MSYSIQVIYERSCSSQAERVISWLTSEGIAAPSGVPTGATEAAPTVTPEGVPTGTTEVAPPVSHSGFVCCSFRANIETPSDAAIVFVSDAATGNEDWKANVRALPDNVRLIPVGVLRDVDYNDPEVVPSCIEAVNFIAVDNRMFENILEALTTSPEFYSMKNHLLNKCNAYVMGRNEGDLLTNVGQIREYSALITNKLATENDPFFSKQLKMLLDYLNVSLKYARSIRRKKILRWIFRGSLAAVCVAILIFANVLKSAFVKAGIANMVMSNGVDQGEPKVNALKMIEGMYNPYSSDSARRIAFARLVECLNKTWDQTPVGIYYKYRLLDCAVPDGSRYFWTSAQNGTVLLWDTYNGKIAAKESVSDQPVYSITLDRAYDSALSDEEKGGDQSGYEESAKMQNAAAIDDEGRIFIRTAGEWSAANASTAADPTLCECIIDGDKMLIYDGDVLEIYDLSSQNAAKTAAYTGADIAGGASILNADIDQGSIVVAARGSDDKLIFAKQAENGGFEYQELAIGLSDWCVSDHHNGDFVITDAYGQVWCVRDGKAEKIPLALPRVIALRFVNENTIVYHERNKGTGIYSLDPFFDYGPVLSAYNVASDLITSDELLAINISGIYYPIAWEDILPVQAESAGGSDAVFAGSSAECTADGAVVCQAWITEYGLIRAVLDSGEEQGEAVIDTAGVLDNMSGYSDNKAIADLPEEYYEYPDKSVVDRTTPTVVGIRHEPASRMNDKSFGYLIIGTENGTLIEIGFQEGDGSHYTSAIHQIPSRAAIVSISQTENGYLVKDRAGLTWRCRSGVNLITKAGACAIIANKLHSAVTTDLYELMEKDIRDRLELEVFPGGDGKEWE